MSSNENEELDEEQVSDEIIGVVFRRSMIGILLLGLVGAWLIWSWSRQIAVPQIRTKKNTSLIMSFERPLEIFPNLAWQKIGNEAGMDFVHFSGATGERLLPETMGGGVALFDFDNNGTLDILFVSGTNWPGQQSERKAGSSLQLYSNDGAGSFMNATAAAKLDASIYGMGCAIGDIDNSSTLSPTRPCSSSQASRLVCFVPMLTRRAC